MEIAAWVGGYLAVGWLIAVGIEWYDEDPPPLTHGQIAALIFLWPLVVGLAALTGSAKDFGAWLRKRWP
jgi:hypothetical protein